MTCFKSVKALQIFLGSQGAYRKLDGFGLVYYLALFCNISQLLITLFYQIEELWFILMNLFSKFQLYQKTISIKLQKYKIHTVIAYLIGSIYFLTFWFSYPPIDIRHYNLLTKILGLICYKFIFLENYSFTIKLEIFDV